MIVVDRRPAAERLLAALDARPGSAAARVLQPAGWLWALGARLRRGLWPERPLPRSIPSLGIGNLRVGGTGKTPVVEDLGRRLRLEGLQVAVLTRGYRARAGGDEPAWLSATGLWVYADPDRGRGFERARADGADRVLLDDALQTRHRPAHLVALVLDRDLQAMPRPLPAGPAREGAAVLDHADAIFVRRESPGSAALPAGALGFRLRPRSFIGPDGLQVEAPSGPGVLLSGLARPESFESDAAATGLELRASWRESDHWSAAAGAARALDAFADRHGAAWILVPEKNLQRCLMLGLRVPVYGLRSRIEWDAQVDPLAWLRARGVRI